MLKTKSQRKRGSKIFKATRKLQYFQLLVWCLGSGFPLRGGPLVAGPLVAGPPVKNDLTLNTIRQQYALTKSELAVNGRMDHASNSQLVESGQG